MDYVDLEEVFQERYRNHLDDIEERKRQIAEVKAQLKDVEDELRCQHQMAGFLKGYLLLMGWWKGDKADEVK